MSIQFSHFIYFPQAIQPATSTKRRTLPPPLSWPLGDLQNPPVTQRCLPSPLLLTTWLTKAICIPSFPNYVDARTFIHIFSYRSHDLRFIRFLTFLFDCSQVYLIIHNLCDTEWKDNWNLSRMGTEAVIPILRNHRNIFLNDLWKPQKTSLRKN